ncbi:MAG TPA: ABC transporter permease [Anaerolineaceae bacterium]|nr:ABC transporter permease [Anaerolineaceae bacterium]
MKSYTFLIVRSVLGQPKRSALILVSILLAVALISATGVLAASLQQTRLNQAIAVTGDFQATLKHLSPAQLDHLKRDRTVADIGSSIPLGSVVNGDVNLTIEGFDAKALELFDFELVAGRFPERPGEIACEAWALEEIAPQVSLGETVRLSYLLYEEDAQGRTIASRRIEGEFTMVGVLADITAARLAGVSLGLVSQSTVQKILPPESVRYTAFVQVDGSPAGIRPALDRLRQNLGVEEEWISINESVLGAMEAGSQMTGPILLLAALILVTSAATIYNIFQITVVERIRQFGMLRAIGAAQGQIAVLVLGEALLICLAAVPLGLLFGVGSAALLAQTLTLLKSQIAALAVPAGVLLAAALTGLVAAVLSALQPALWAAQISPMAAIRSVGGRGQIRASRLPLLFRRWQPRGRYLLARMANGSLWRNRLRSLVSIFSLGLGILLTILFSHYASGLNTDSVVQKFLRGSFAVKSTSLLPGNGYPEETANTIDNLPGVTRVIRTRLDDLNYVLLPVDEIDATEAQKLESAAQRNGIPAGVAQPGTLPVPAQVFGFDVEELLSLTGQLIEGRIDRADLAGGGYAVVVDPPGVFGLHPGDLLTVKKIVLRDGQPTVQVKSFEIAAVVSDQPVYMGYSLAGPEILLTDVDFKAYTGSSLYKRFDITIDAGADPLALEDSLRQIAGSIPGGTLVTYEDMRQDLEQEKRDVLMLVYGLVGMVTLIGAMNIVNTLTTNLILRTREFGTLRAIGMTEDQLKTVTRLEGLLYGLYSAAWGAAGGTILAGILHKWMAAQGPVDPAFSWPSILLASAGGVAVSVAATIVPARRIARLTIIEALRTVE